MSVNVVAVAVLSIAVTLLCLLLKNVRPELAMATAVTASVILLLYLLTCLSPVTALITALTAKTDLPAAFIKDVFRALGICTVTAFAAESCADAGQNALAAKVELAGRIAVIAVCVPMLTEIVSLIRTVLP
ncbi:MAG: hypothetical protein IJC25_01270 [Clostridia bacterium]|nr:hypothetical protein [Clostridia bacterium]